MYVSFILGIVSLAVVSFAGGVVIGIIDCKRKFAIPKSAVGVDADGKFIYS